MNITYRCMQCGSNDINVRVLLNLKTKTVVSKLIADGSDEQCYCNDCRHWTTFGWMEEGAILQNVKENKNE